MTELNASQALGFFTTGLDVVKSKKLMKDIMFYLPKDLSEAFNQTEDFIAIEEDMGSLKPHSQLSDRSGDRDKSNHPRSGAQPKRSFNNGGSGGGNFNNGGSRGCRPPFLNWGVNKVYTLLNTDRTKILEEMKNKPYFELCPANTKP